ncbi:MAG: hypothetical protein O3C65_13050 [Proteobacteria bacterium]|nr:hypothetical protein [Pseudomonadota bacterium]
MRFLSLGIRLVERQTGKNWRKDDKTREAVKAAVSTAFDTYGWEGAFSAAKDGSFGATDTDAKARGHDLMEGLIAQFESYRWKSRWDGEK